LQKEYGKFQIQFGMSTTPVLLDDQLIFGLMHGKMRNDTSTSVGKILSLNKKTGEENWLHLRKTDAISENKHVYASPTIDYSGHTPQLIIHGADYTTGHSTEDGSEVWRLGGMNPKGDSYNPYLRFVASATCANGKVIIPTAKRGPVLAISSGLTGKLTRDSLTWRSDRVTPDVATPIYYRDRIFLARENGTLACLDADSGEKLVEKRYMADKHRSTPVAVDEKLVITDRSGKVILVQADDSLNEISSIELGEETTASPAVSGGKIFVRTFDALYAFGEK
jgi:outer membrane protein assembly factor BamB